MAIELVSKPLDNEIRAEFPNAYLKIHDIEIRISSSEAWIRILVFANKVARDTDGASSIKKVTKRVSLACLNATSLDKNAITAAAYEWIKKQPEFQGIDV